ncbi:MAG: 5-(carboxyamino)imidazole ribonucleotide mutase [Candidatus Omnitrophica bacterium]|nr:5-(carboxyamino)imidazole ribonucleotide mutase [Candidatus Omnitrophota bacterium]
MKSPEVAVLLGSDSDLPLIEPGLEIFKKFGISYKVMVCSAHRSPELVRDFVSKAKGEGIKVLIAAAGGAAHLAGVLAAHSILPVIGIPIPTKELGGMDSLLSTVQMPSGVPVATVAVGKAGAINAAVLAAQILALNSLELSTKLMDYKKDLEEGVKQKNENLKSAGK